MKTIIYFLFLTTFVFAQNSRVVKDQPTRLPNGKPGAGYWQQQIDYKVDAELEIVKGILTGKEIITYTNNSPDTLNELWWHLYQNIFNEKSEARKEGNIVGRAMTATKGITIEKIIISGKEITPFENETLMKTILPYSLNPNQKIEIEVWWNYEVPKIATLRTGSNEIDFGMCQWYPQIAVYDDLRGWDKTPYLGQGEFYLNYGNWEANITVPGNYIVAGTGILQNTNEVLSEAQLKKYNSISSDSVIQIISKTETDTSRNSLKKLKQIWRFKAENVRDFAWAASPRFIWDATKTNAGVLIHAFYLPSEAENWKDGANLNKFTIEYFSKEYGNYIYPQATVISGPVYGMEYPMLVFVSAGEQFTNSMEMTLIHELGHEWYPMMIGSHETNYPFMDEGFNTYITSTAVGEKFGNSSLIKREFFEKTKYILQLPETNDKNFNQYHYISKAIQGSEISLSASSYDARGDQYGVYAYAKPGSILWMLRDMLGDEVFSNAMKEYYNRWLLKHPYPEDFFNTIEDVAGRDLDWFWNQWIYQTWKLDLALLKIINEKTENGFDATFKIASLEKAIMPTTIRLTLADGTIRDERFSEDVFTNLSTGEFVVKNLPSKVVSAEIDPNQNLSDINRLNNRWPFAKFNFTYGLGGFWNSIAPKLDAYNINFSPTIAYNKIDGIEGGIGVSGNYFGNRSFELDTYFGKEKPDFQFFVSRNLEFFGPNYKTTISVEKFDGFRTSKWLTQHTSESYFGFLGNKNRRISISAGFKTAELIDTRYERVPNSWDRGQLVAGFVIYKNGLTTNKLIRTQTIKFEFGAPQSDFQYSKFTLENNLNLKFGKKNNFKTRFFLGSSNGNIPNQAKLYLTQSSPFDQIDNAIFRIPVFSNYFYEHALVAGGGNLFRTTDTTAKNIIAINTSVNLFGINLFADAGKVWNDDKLTAKNLNLDAGFAFQFIDVSSEMIHLGLNSLAIYFPIYISDPLNKNQKEFDWKRWKIVFGVRL